jgi:hypothetical protein
LLSKRYFTKNNAAEVLLRAPATFGSFGGDLLIGQFGDGEIPVYDPSTDQFLGTLNGPNGMPIANPFLWALDFRTGGTNVNPDALYFTAGYNNQVDGLFGKIQATPEPGTIALVLSGLSFLGTRRLLRRQKRQASERSVPHPPLLLGPTTLLYKPGR